MKLLIHKIIEKIITSQSILKDHPKPGVIFLAPDSLFNELEFRKIISDAIASVINPLSFDSVAGVASRGYLFSEMIGDRFAKGENLIQKAKSRDNTYFIQQDIQTEYSSDTLQVRKDTIQAGKKYLIADDLIATGGSVLASVKLIKDCGGKVDTVFVMTELLDFKAREALEKEGVKLVSLLKFTQQDLQHLLLLQEDYRKNPSSPIHYELSHHRSASFEPQPLVVHVASQSSIKKQATQLVFEERFISQPITVIEHAVSSDVNSQPNGYKETKQGAINRLEALKKSIINSDNAFLVSIENGIRYSEQDQAYYDFVHAIVQKDDQSFSYTQDCCKIPQEIIDNIDKNAQETWGQTAKRMGLVQDEHNPHQEIQFGGNSRLHYIEQAIRGAMNGLKENRVEPLEIKSDNRHFNMNRLITLNHSTLLNKYAKKGIFFTPTKDLLNHPINLYNQGCPFEKWQLDAKAEQKKNSFKIFSTGDPFSILSADVKIAAENVNIHVGVEHATYSPLVLLQEALQLCRCVYEHGAGGITVALPEQFHPILHSNDFNFLLMKLFKASGANKVYFYDKNYRGVLDQTNISNLIPFTLGEQKDVQHYQISQKDLSDYLQTANNAQNNSLDSQIMSSMRTNSLSSFVRKSEFKSGLNKTNLIKKPAPIQIPETKEHTHVILCCSGNRPLAEKIAENLREQGENVKFYFIQGKGEKATIPNDAIICGATVTIVQSTRPNPDNADDVADYQKNGAASYFFEAEMVARQAYLRGANKINFINPYQFNARSDKAEDNPKGKTGAYVQQNGMLLEAAGVNHVITAECHDGHTMSGSYTGKNIKGSAIGGLNAIATKVATDWLNSPASSQGQLRLVTPDAGAVKRTKELTLQLQASMGKKYSNTGIAYAKERDSHKDDSARINSFSVGDIDFNSHDKYLITDDETATGNTLCQAIINLKSSGASDISVIIIHNNMPLDWLERQLCLARFLYFGVQDMHFSDTQEMGSLAKNFEDLIQVSLQKSSLTKEKIEKQIFTWFEKNISKDFSDKSPEYLQQKFFEFKMVFSQLESRVTIHSLANEFANKVSMKHQTSVLENAAVSPAVNTCGFYSSMIPLFSPVKLSTPSVNDSALLNSARSSNLNYG